MIEKGKKKYILLLLVICTLFIQMTCPTFLMELYGEDNAIDKPISIKKSVSNDQIMPGQQFHYQIEYTVHDLENDYLGVYVEDILPEGVEYISVARNNHISDTAINYIEAERKLEIHLVSLGDNTLGAGATGVFQVNVRIKEGIIGDNVTFTNVATIKAIGVNPIRSNEVTVTTYGTKSYWETFKNKIIPSVNPAVGSEVTYSVGLTEDKSVLYGHINLKDVVLVDTLPENSEFVLATGGGNYDGVNHTVSWNLNDNEVEVGDEPSREITIKYPEGKFTTGSAIENIATATGKDLQGDNVNILSSSATITLEEPSPPLAGSFNFNKTKQYLYRNIGQTQRFYLNGLKNKSNTAIDNFIVEDINLPSQLQYKKISQSAGKTYTFKYQVNNNTWKTYGTTSSTAINVDDLNIEINEYLTGIQLDYGTVPASFDAGKITIEGTVISPDNEGAIVSHGDVISNEASLSYSYNNIPSIITSSTVFYINKEKPWLSVGKKHDESKFYIPGDNVDFQITIANKSAATGNYKNPVIYDILPVKFDYVSGSAILAGGAINKDPNNKPNFEESSITINGEEHVLLKWSWVDPLNIFEVNIGDSFKISYQTSIQEHTSATITNTREYINETYITTNEDLDVGFWWGTGSGHNDFINEKVSIRDDLDLDNDGTKEEYLVKAIDDIYINETATAEMTKFNKGVLDSDYNKYPDTGLTVEGGTADYKLEIFNAGNVKLDRIQVIDILPYIGDTAVLTNQDRESKWRPNLIGSLSEGSINSNGITADLDVFYSTSSDKNYINFDYNKLDTNYWITEIPNNYDITAIQSLYFDITNINGGSGLDPGEKFYIEWKMRAPVGAPSNIIAYNSFASKLTTINGTSLLPSEPIKVGFEVSDDDKGQIGNFVWFDGNLNGIQDDGYDNEEAGINGIVVKLFKVGEPVTPVDQTLTANHQDGRPGFYLFPHLSSGDYYVEFTVPDYYDITTASIGDEEKDSDGVTKYAGNPGYIKTKTDIITLVYDVNLGPSYRKYDIDLGLVSKEDSFASLTVTKAAISVENQSINPSLQPVNNGETIEYDIEINNNGTVPLYNVKIQDFMDRNQIGFTFTEIGKDKNNLMDIDENINVIDYVNSGSTPYLIVNTIKPNDTLYLKGIYKVKSSDIDQTSLDNVIKVFANEIKDGKDITSTVEIDIADVSINKTSSESEVEPEAGGRDTIHYTISVTNNSNITLNEILVTDNNIDEYTNVDINDKLSTTTAGIIISSLSSGESTNITGKYTSDTNDLGDNIINVAEVTHPNIRHSVKDNNIVGTKGISIIKSETSTGPYEVGETVNYQIKTTNTGTVTLANIDVTDNLFNKNKGTQYSTIKTYTINSLAPGATNTQEISYEITKDDLVELSKSSLKNIAYAKIDNMNQDANTNEVTVDTKGIAITKSGIKAEPDKLLELGDRINYTFELENIGSAYLHNVIINDPILVLNENIGTITPGAIVTYNYNYTVQGKDLPGPIINTVTVNCDENTGDNDIDYIGDAKVDIIKNVVKGHKSKDYIVDNYNDILTSDYVTDSRGSEITYVFTIINIGDTHLNNISIIDSDIGIDHDDMTFISELSSSNSFDDSTNIAGNNDNDNLVFYYQSTIESSLLNTAKVIANPSTKDNNDIPNMEMVESVDTARVKIPNKVTNNIGDYIWVDKDLDGIQDDDEVGISGIKVKLKNTSGTIVKIDTTDVDGKYLLEGVKKGKYTVIVDSEELSKRGYTASYDLDGNKDGITDVYLKDFDILNIDFGYYIPNPSLLVTKEADKTTALVDERINYSINITNNGNIPINNIIVKDELLDLEETISQIKSGESKIFNKEYIVQAADIVDNHILNTVIVNSDETNQISDNWDVDIKEVTVIDEEIEETTKETTEEITEEKIGEETVTENKKIIFEEEIEEGGTTTYTPPNDVKIIEIVEEPKGGKVVIEDGKIKYTPDEKTKVDSFKVRVTKDGSEEIIEIEFKSNSMIGNIGELPKTGRKSYALLYLLAMGLLIFGVFTMNKIEKQ